MTDNTKYVLNDYYWLMNEGVQEKVLSRCVLIKDGIAYFQTIGLSVFYTEKDFEFAKKAIVK